MTNLKFSCGYSANRTNTKMPNTESTEPKERASVPVMKNDLLAKSIDDATMRAARHLPKGYEITICINNDGCGVALVFPNGGVEAIDSGEDSLLADLNAALCEANGFSG